MAGLERGGGGRGQGKGEWGLVAMGLCLREDDASERRTGAGRLAACDVWVGPTGCTGGSIGQGRAGACRGGMGCGTGTWEGVPRGQAGDGVRGVCVCVGEEVGPGGEVAA